MVNASQVELIDPIIEVVRICLVHSDNVGWDAPVSLTEVFREALVPKPGCLVLALEGWH